MFKYLAPVGFSIILPLTACSASSDREYHENGGSSGMAGGGKTSGQGGQLTASGGSLGSGGGNGGAVSGGVSNGGSSNGGSQQGGASNGGTQGNVAGGGASNGGSAGTGMARGGTGNGGTGNGGQSSGGTTNGSGGASKGGATGAGGSGTGGNVGSGGSSGGGSVGVSKMPVPPGAANVPKPSGTGSSITVLNWAGFKGAVTYSFDDANSSQIQHYSTDLKPLGVPFTFFLWTGKSDASNSIWSQALKDGHELANHTQSHSSNGTSGDIDAATQFIMQKFGVQAWTMAAPNGAPVYTQLANGKFMINRGVSNNLIGPNDGTDPFTLPTYIPPQGASASAFNQQVDDARSAGKWRTMCIHGFTGGSDSAYQPVPIDQFVASVQHAKQLGDMWIDTMTNVGAYWRGQKAFSQATTMTSGSDKTWTWKLPDHFPPGHYLRVKVDGGTLKQKGTALEWDSHGYYEISLDALSVTLSP